MKVIALYGSANTGKTGTLKLLIDELLREGAVLISPDDVSRTDDVRCCIRTKSGKMICITTSGDDGVNQKLNKVFVRYCGGVDVWITASRNYGRSVEEIWRDETFKVDEVIWIHKMVCEYVYKQVKDKWDEYIQVENMDVVRNDYEICNYVDARRIKRVACL